MLGHVCPALRRAVRRRCRSRDRWRLDGLASVREHRGAAWIGAGIAALAAYGFVATFQDDPNFGRILAAYGGIFVAGSLAWGVVFDGFRPDRYDVTGALVCLAGVGVIMYSPRPA